MASDKRYELPPRASGMSGAKPLMAAGVGKKTFRLPWSGLGFSLAILVWQLIFFVFPLAFLVTISFWVVRNYRMVPTFEWLNWSYMLSRGFFWDAYLHTLGMAAGATVLGRTVAF